MMKFLVGTLLFAVLGFSYATGVEVGQAQIVGIITDAGKRGYSLDEIRWAVASTGAEVTQPQICRVLTEIKGCEWYSMDNFK